MNFETVAAAVAYATSTLPEAFWTNATIKAGEVTLHWADIDASKSLKEGRRRVRI